MADDRTYIRVHDGMDEHPKIEPLSDAAFRLLFKTWFYCSRQLTDGALSLSAWQKRGTPKTRRELESASLIHLPGDVCSHEDCTSPPPGFIQMHDYLDWQRSAAEVAEIKAAKGAGGSLGNHIRWHVRRRQADPQCQFCIANGSQERSDMRSDDRSQTDRSPIANGSHSHKQRQIQTEENSLEGGSHVSRGSDTSTPPVFPDHCQQHANDPAPGKCGLCADARKARAAMPRLSLVATPAGIPHCGQCDETRHRETPFGVIRCPECHPSAEEAS